MKRLVPLEPRLTRVEDQLAAARAECERTQHEVTAHQAGIRRLLEEKSAALEQLAARGQALDAAQLQVRELTGASRERLALQELNTRLEAELGAARGQLAAQGSLQTEHTRQLALARRLLMDAHETGVRRLELGGSVCVWLACPPSLPCTPPHSDDRAKLGSTQADLDRARAGLAAKTREAQLLQDRLAAAEQQLRHQERQLAVVLAAGGHAAAARPAGDDLGPAGVQLRRLLEVKEERIK